MGLASPLSAHPWCLLLWAGCHEAALSRLPSRMLHFSVWRETVAVINLAGAFQAVDVAQLTPAVGGHWYPQPLAHLSASTHPTPSARGAAQHPPASSAAPRTVPILLETSPCPRLGVWGWAPACHDVSQGFCFCLALLCFVCSQSVSFVSVFAKKIRSLPPRHQPRYQPGLTAAIVSLNNPGAGENSRSETCRRAAVPLVIVFPRASLPWGGRAEN